MAGEAGAGEVVTMSLITGRPQVSLGACGKGPLAVRDMQTVAAAPCSRCRAPKTLQHMQRSPALRQERPAARCGTSSLAALPAASPLTTLVCRRPARHRGHAAAVGQRGGQRCQRQ